MARLAAIVLSYNKAWIIDRFFESLEQQTRPPDSVLVVDDASTDGTSKILSERFSKWPVLTLQENGGQAHARNAGLRATDSDYVTFLDGDVVMKPRMLEILEQALETNPKASVAYGHYERKGSRKGIIRALPWSAETLAVGNYVSAVSMVRRMDLPNPAFDESLRRYEDWDLWLRMARAGRRGVLVDEILFEAYYAPSDLSGEGESELWRRRVARKHQIKVV